MPNEYYDLLFAGGFLALMMIIAFVLGLWVGYKLSDDKDGYRRYHG